MVAPAEPVLKTKMEDMGSLKAPKAKSGPKYRDPMEILQESTVRDMKGQGDPNKILNGLSVLMKMGIAKPIQMGNTVFVIFPKQAGIVEVHLATLDRVQDLPDRFRNLANTLKQMGYKQAVLHSDNPAFDRIADRVGLPIKKTTGTQTMGGKQIPVTQYIVSL
jgi:hypothetical protein